MKEKRMKNGSTEEEEKKRLKAGGKLKVGYLRPYIVHRAILGSLERCIAILCEHFVGKWPFWLSPRQIRVIPIHKEINDYAIKVTNRYKIEKFFVDCDLSNDKIKKKIRKAQLEQYNYIICVGNREQDELSVTIRDREDNKWIKTMSVAESVQFFKKQYPQKSKTELELLKNSI